MWSVFGSGPCWMTSEQESVMVSFSFIVSLCALSRLFLHALFLHLKAYKLCTISEGSRIYCPILIHSPHFSPGVLHYLLHFKLGEVTETDLKTAHNILQCVRI